MANQNNGANAPISISLQDILEEDDGFNYRPLHHYAHLRQGPLPQINASLTRNSPALYIFPTIDMAPLEPPYSVLPSHLVRNYVPKEVNATTLSTTYRPTKHNYQAHRRIPRNLYFILPRELRDEIFALSLGGIDQSIQWSVIEPLLGVNRQMRQEVLKLWTMGTVCLVLHEAVTIMRGVLSVVNMYHLVESLRIVRPGPKYIHRKNVADFVGMCSNLKTLQIELSIEDLRKYSNDGVILPSKVTNMVSDYEFEIFRDNVAIKRLVLVVTCEIWKFFTHDDDALLIALKMWFEGGAGKMSVCVVTEVN
ncbi:hypothetical protein EJ08DRAFT_662684 [Tothia fuscella]|uniref:Uncharacterized protein n=1 Tax=Tothia fuscella TaxID=1048955 RepID=A0A9P4TVM5_9PEZI|nr:hypothetical protein EJ08DRAFT_662684 [Tothia fuscella]